MGSPDRSERGHRRVLTEALIVEQAARLFIQWGYHGTTMNDLAAALQVTKPALYYHFESKDVLILATIDRASQHARRLLEFADTDLSALQKVLEFSERYAKALSDPIFRSMATMDHRGLEPRGRAALRVCKRTIRDQLSLYIDEYNRAVEQSDIDSIGLCHVIFGALNWSAISAGERPERAIGVVLTTIRCMLERPVT